MKKVIFIFILLCINMYAQDSLQAISKAEQITAYQDSILYAIQVDSPTGYKWARITFPTLIAILKDSVGGSSDVDSILTAFDVNYKLLYSGLSQEIKDSIAAGGGGQVVIADMLGTPTTYLLLNTWTDALSNWQDSFNENMEKIDNTSFFIDPRYFVIENDTLKLKWQALGTIYFYARENLVLPYHTLPYDDYAEGGIATDGQYMFFNHSEARDHPDTLMSFYHFRENFDSQLGKTDLIIQGESYFAGSTDTLEVISVPQATVSWNWQVTPIWNENTPPTATDILSVKPFAGGVEIRRPAGGSALLSFRYVGFAPGAFGN